MLDEVLPSLCVEGQQLAVRTQGEQRLSTPSSDHASDLRKLNSGDSSRQACLGMRGEEKLVVLASMQSLQPRRAWPNRQTQRVDFCSNAGFFAEMRQIG